MNADKIVVVDKGAVVEIGTHESLLAKEVMNCVFLTLARCAKLDLNFDSRVSTPSCGTSSVGLSRLPQNELELQPYQCARRMCSVEAHPRDPFALCHET